MIQIKIKEPVILNTLCAIAQRFASLDWPILANNAVMVVPILSPSRIGIAPTNPITLAPSGPACDAKLCSTAIVAELLCTTSVISIPTPTPSTGMWLTFSIILINTGLVASGFMTSPIISIPTNNKPNAKIVWPINFIFSFFAINAIRNPINTIGII